ncbi:hypothetical protein RchiOBHm_Chr2g0113171 [Rosa chinensis]|uniref:Uncharacterized protein n=1 Tax=Rosa chinensis TaxID=74649 RepID=A0A2P6RQE6_ROSCH|nr:hypothetical protein RchiOBHm_Chr2g0113171 [Rosa chinensis]
MDAGWEEHLAQTQHPIGGLKWGAVAAISCSWLGEAEEKYIILLLCCKLS